MKSNELRAGNWVLCNGLRTPVNAQLLLEIEKGNIQFQVEPLPITEDWLKRFGFEKTNNDGDNFWLKLKTAEFELITDESSGANAVWLNRMKRPVAIYVHQLQNLYYALTNEELALNETE